MEFVRIGNSDRNAFDALPDAVYTPGSERRDEYFPRPVPPAPLKIDSRSLDYDNPQTPTTSGRESSSSSSDGGMVASGSQRPSETETLVTLDHLPKSSRSDEMFRTASSRTQILSPVISAPSDSDAKSIEMEDVSTNRDQERRPSGQTLKEFFQENPAAGLENAAQDPAAANAPISATAYFNRQASLLMLYFPLAVSDA
jgi:hypothetical protein